MGLTLQELRSAFVLHLAAIFVGCGSGVADPLDSADARAASALPEAGISVAEGGQGAAEASAPGEAAPSIDASDAWPIVEGGALDGDDGAAACSPYITNVIRIDYGLGAGFGQTAFPRVVEGPPSGAGCCKGSLNGLSLGDGGSIVAEVGQTTIDG